MILKNFKSAEVKTLFQVIVFVAAYLFLVSVRITLYLHSYIVLFLFFFLIAPELIFLHTSLFESAPMS